MKLMFSSVLALLNIQSALCTTPTVFPTATCVGLQCCPFTTQVTGGSITPTPTSNCVLNKLLITLGPVGAGAGTANFNLFQRVGPNGKKILYIQLLPPTVAGAFPQPGVAVVITVTLNPLYTILSTEIPLIYTFMSSLAGVTFAQVSNTVITYTFTTPTNYLSAIFTIAELGYVNAAKYALVGTTLTATFSSDLFSTNPFVATVTTFTGIVPNAYTLPTNQSSILCTIRKMFKRSVVSACVTERDIRKMEVAAFLNDIGCCFRCKEPCPKTICDTKVYVEYITFITACIKTIVYCEQSKVPAKIDFCPCGTRSFSACVAVNTEICKFSKSCNVEASVNTEICAMFSDICAGELYEPVCDYVCPVIEPESCTVCEEETTTSSEIVCASSSSSSEEEMKKRKVVAKKRAEVKTSTSVSTYGWYIAGGVVAVSVAVVVYVFVL